MTVEWESKLKVLLSDLVNYKSHLPQSNISGPQHSSFSKLLKLAL